MASDAWPMFQAKQLQHPAALPTQAFLVVAQFTIFTIAWQRTRAWAAEMSGKSHKSELQNIAELTGLKDSRDQIHFLIQGRSQASIPLQNPQPKGCAAMAAADSGCSTRLIQHFLNCRDVATDPCLVA